LRDGEIGEGQVELAALDEPQQVDGAALLADADGDARPLGAEAAQERGEKALADALVDADAERADLAAGERRHVRSCGVETGDDRVRVPEQKRPGLRQLDAAGAAWAVEEALPDDLLELGDLLADGGLRVAELARRRAERARARDRLERGEVAQLDAEPLIGAHD